MFSSWIFWVVLVIVVLGVLIYFPAHEDKKDRACREARAKEKAARNAQCIANLRKYSFSVHIREKDGRKSAFEAELIKELITKGITVHLLSEKNGRAVADGDVSSLKDDDLALVGTSWCKNGVTAETISGLPVSDREVYCDYRLLQKTDSGSGRILFASCDDSSEGGSLAGTIVHCLASALEVTFD